MCIPDEAGKPQIPTHEDIEAFHVMYDADEREYEAWLTELYG